MKGVGSGWRETGESVADRQIVLKSKSQLIAHACFVFWKKTCFTRINDDLVERERREELEPRRDKEIAKSLKFAT